MIVLFRKILPLGALVLFLPTIPVDGAFSISDQQSAVANRVVGLIVDCRFDSSRSVIDSMIHADTSDAFGYLLSLSLTGLRDLDYEDIAESAAFERDYTRLRGLIDNMGTTADRSYVLTMSGFADATYAAYCLRRKRYREGVSVGLGALGQLKDAKKTDPDNHDVDFFLGLYECAKAELKQKLWWVLFWYSGSVEEGIAQLEGCVAHGRFASMGAVLALADIYTSEEQYARAETLLDSVTSIFPQSRFLRWSRARLLEARQEWSRAAAQYDLLWQEYREIPSAVRNAVTTRNKFAHALHESGDSKRALEICTEIVAMYQSSDDEHISDMVKDTRALMERIKRDK